MTEPEVCVRCGLQTGEDQQVYPHNHLTPQDCIRALRRMLKRQKKLAASLSFDLSTRYLAALEELSLRPDVGVVYQIRAEGPEYRPLAVPPQQVSGVFAAILRKFKELGDWSPLQRAEAEATSYAYMAGKLTALLLKVVDQSKDRCNLDVKLPASSVKEIEDLVEDLGTRGLMGRSRPD